MGNQLLNENFIRQRSEELGMPFENLLAASVLEEIVHRIAESQHADSFWMKDSARLNLENYKNRVDRNLSFFIKDTQKFHYKKSDVSSTFAELFKNVKKDAVHWNYSVWMDRDIYYVNLIAAVSSIKVPVKIKLDRVKDENLEPYSRDVKLFTNNNLSVRVRCFPSEYVVADKFLEILDKLELLNDLSCYMDIYEILKKEALSGRKACGLLQEGCRKRGIAVEEGRMKLLLSYRSYSYMKKKWKSFLRHEKRKGPGWEEMMDLVERFFLVIWEHMCRNLIYLGDWMPEVGRFMD